MRLYLDTNRFILTEEGIDLSVPLVKGKENVNAWYCDPVSIEPVVRDDFVGEVTQGGAVNFRNIKLNPHGNGTHTECVGHIAKEPFTINQCLREFHFLARVVSVTPSEVWNETYQETDKIIDVRSLAEKLNHLDDEKALIVRTLPNPDEKRTCQYSGTNPAYFSKEAIHLINEKGIEHLMVDLPSVDRENDGGKVAGHHAFWSYPENTQKQKTISELLYIPNDVEDGKYLVQIQIMSLESDASPGKILIHRIYQI